MARSVSQPSEQSANLRNLKVLVVLLVISNILVGVLGVYLLRSVDRRYSELVDRAVPALSDLRELLTETVAAMRSTNPTVLTGPGVDRAAAVKAIPMALATEREVRARLLKSGSLKDDPAGRASLQETGDEFGQLITNFSQLYSAGKTDEALAMRESKLRPAFDRHLAAIGKAADAVETLSLVASKNFSTRTSGLTAIVLGVASWPVIVLLGLILLTALFVVAMMIAFRGKDLADTP